MDTTQKYSLFYRPAQMKTKTNLPGAQTVTEHTPEPRTIIKCDKKAGLALIKILEIEPKCHSCNVDITENNFGGVYNQPNRVFCDNITCIIEVDND